MVISKVSLFQVAVLTVVLASSSMAAPKNAGKSIDKSAPAASATNQQSHEAVSAPPTPAAQAASERGVTTSESVSSLTVAAPSEQKILGAIDIRPTYYLDNTRLGSENTVLLGYQFNKSARVHFEQFIDTAGDIDKTGGSMPVLRQSDLRLILNDLAGDANTGVSLAYEPRLRLSYDPQSRAAGKVMEVRNYIKFTHNLSPAVSLTVMDAPIVHIYEQAYPLNNTGKTNPFLENRVIGLVSINFTEKLNLAVPVWYSVVAARENGGLTKGASHGLYAWPELTYAIDPNISLGAAYYTGKFALDGSGTFTDGFTTDAAAQVFVRASL